MNITKKGDKHLQTLFIHGVRAVVRVATNNNDVYLNQWVKQLKESREFNKTTVEIAKEGANKRGNSSRLTQSFHFFMFEPIFSPVNALNQPI